MKPLIVIFLLLTAGIALAASIYKYECPRCHLIQEYGMPGIYKCPTDGSILIPKIGK